MRNASQYKNNKHVPTIVMIACPSCDKKKLTKYQNTDGTTDTARNVTINVRGEERYLEVCDTCDTKYKRTDENFVIENMRKLAKAMQASKNKDGESDHKDFSLN